MEAGLNGRGCCDEKNAKAWRSCRAFAELGPYAGLTARPMAIRTQAPINPATR